MLAKLTWISDTLKTKLGANLPTVEDGLEVIYNTHKIKTYTSLADIGLADSDMLTDDFQTNITLIANSMANSSMLFYTGTTNLGQSVVTKINTDTGSSYVVSTIVSLTIKKVYNSTSVVIIEATLDSTNWFDRIYECVFNNSATDLRLLSAFTMRHGVGAPNVQANYLAFVGGNTNQVDAAFGKNNELYTQGIGMALALYARFKSNSGSPHATFPNLRFCHNLTAVLNNTAAKLELWDNAYTRALVLSSAFARTKLSTYNTLTVNYENGDTQTHNVEVTQEHLDGTRLLYIEYSITNANIGNIVDSYITLNGKDVARVSGANATATNNLFLAPATYGITKAGTYTLIVYAYVGGAPAYASSASVIFVDTK